MRYLSIRFIVPFRVTIRFGLRILLGLAFTIAANVHSQPFALTADRAFQTSFPTKESYQYQLFSSPDLTNWFPASDKIVGCGGSETFTFRITNSSTFYRGEEFPPDLTRRLVGLTNVFLGTAFLSSTQGASLQFFGMRVQSRDYTFNDYVIASYNFDFCKQQLSATQVEVLTNVGITTVPGATTFFFKDATGPICITNGASTYCSQDTGYSLTSTGQVMFVGLQAGQLISVKTTTTSSSGQFRYVVTDPIGKEIYNYSPVPAPTTFTFGAFQALRTGRYSIQFIPLNASSFSMTLRFVNTNGRAIRTLVNGATYSSSLRNYGYDYDKFQVTLNAGQNLSVSGLESGTALTLYNSMGVYQAGISGTGPLSFQATVTDTYYLMFYNSDGVTHSVTIAPSIF